MSQSKQPPRSDVFAQIALTGQKARNASLVVNPPPAKPKRKLPASKHDPKAAFKAPADIDTADKLAAELARQRRRHAPFLLDLAPPMEPTRLVLNLEQFDWRVESPAGQPDQAWQSVRIPHYGPPLGPAVTYYRSGFEVSQAMLDKGCLMACFDGVDYKAHVFVNGSYVGSHEGFFAPFEFDITSVARLGPNTLLVKVQNDAIMLGNGSWMHDGEAPEGDKVYAASGLGYDEPTVGWHHCPPAMGIYQAVRIEARPAVHVHDLFVRPQPEQERAEVWIEVRSAHTLQRTVAVDLAIMGQNFRKLAHRSRHELGDAGAGINFYRVGVDLPKPRLWEPDSPWLYQLQVRLHDLKAGTVDAASRQFGMRSFRMDVESQPKGQLFLNGQPIRLRGANTMGFEQQDVMHADWDRLIDDILLAKICHMNFLRLTQRPVQRQVYDYCDRLGLMTQTDLPLFGYLRTTQFCEAVRQAGEMERLVRSHPCNIMVSYINEPFEAESGKRKHRHLTRPELESFFTAADQAVRLANPDRVIKAVDGDYVPPGPGLPDNHCYCCWYNGHGVDIGKLNRGYWQAVKPGWNYGCGEFGAEGLDNLDVMLQHYPKDWLPPNADEERTWMPDRIVMAQTGRMHYMWFDTQHSVKDWIAAGQAHQAWGTRLMTEAFRRDPRMVSIAIHLFIDAFPSGWMKSIMDVHRSPKPAYFEYRRALAPLMVSLRTDRYAFLSGEAMDLEAWVCNDLNAAPAGAYLHYQMEMNGKVIFASKAPASVPVNSSRVQGSLALKAPPVNGRATVTVRLGLLDRRGKVLASCATELAVFAQPAALDLPVRIVGQRNGQSAQLARELGLRANFSSPLRSARTILVDGRAWAENRQAVEQAADAGALVVVLDLPAGMHELAGSQVRVADHGAGSYHFASRATGHPLVEGFESLDFRFWHDDEAGYVKPFLPRSFRGEGWDAILTSGDQASRDTWFAGDRWEPSLAAAQRALGSGLVRLCQVQLARRTRGNPAARILAQRLLSARG